MSGFRKVSEERLHEGPFFHLADVTFSSPSGETFRRQIVRHPGAVAIVAITDDNEVLLVRQFRGSVEAEVLEIPAGLLDVPGESLAVAAERELREETGMEADQLDELTAIQVALGITDERITIFVARGLRHVGADLQGPEEQHMSLLHVPMADALAMVRSGEIVDAKTVVGLLMVADRS